MWVRTPLAVWALAVLGQSAALEASGPLDDLLPDGETDADFGDLDGDDEDILSDDTLDSAPAPAATAAPPAHPTATLKAQKQQHLDQFDQSTVHAELARLEKKMDWLQEHSVPLEKFEWLKEHTVPEEKYAHLEDQVRELEAQGKEMRAREHELDHALHEERANDAAIQKAVEDGVANRVGPIIHKLVHTVLAVSHAQKEQTKTLTRTRQEMLTVVSEEQSENKEFKDKATSDISRLKQDLSGVLIETMPKWTTPRALAAAPPQGAAAAPAPVAASDQSWSDVVPEGKSLDKDAQALDVEAAPEKEEAPSRREPEGYEFNQLSSTTRVGRVTHKAAQAPALAPPSAPVATGSYPWSGHAPQAPAAAALPAATAAPTDSPSEMQAAFAASFCQTCGKPCPYRICHQ